MYRVTRKLTYKKLFMDKQRACDSNCDFHHREDTDEALRHECQGTISNLF